MFGMVENNVLKRKGGRRRRVYVQCLAWLKTVCPIWKSGCDDAALFGAIGHGDPKRNCSGGYSRWVIGED
jgi:hypothetical protein